MAVTGIVAFAAFLPLSAWLGRSNNDTFNIHVGWANILSFSVAAIGLALVLADMRRKASDASPERLAKISDRIAREVVRQAGLELSGLLGTDQLDSRAAAVKVSPLRRHERTRVKGRRGDIENLVDFYLKETGGRMLVLGDAGSGKTVLATRLATDLIAKRDDGGLTSPMGATPVAIVFSLPTWSQALDMSTWLADQLTLRFQITRRTASQLVDDGWILPILDSLDEMDNEGDAPDGASAAITHINRHIATTVKARVVVVSRAGHRYYDRINTKLRDVVTVAVEPLGETEIRAYLREHCGPIVDSARWREVLRRLAERTSFTYRLLSTPWRLSVATTYQNGGGDLASLLTAAEGEKTKARARGRSNRSSVIDVDAELYETLIRAKTGLYRRRGYSYDRVRKELAGLSSLLVDAADSSSKVDLLLHECWKRVDERKVAVRQALAGFFAAHVPFAVASGNFGMLSGSGGWKTWIGYMSNYALLMFFASNRAYRGALTLKLRGGALLTARGAIIAAIGIAASVIFGILTIAAVGPVYGIAAGGASALMFCIVAMATGSAAHASSPMEPMRADLLVNALLSGATAVLMGSYMAWLYGTEVGILYGAAYGLAAITASSYVRYLIAVYMMAQRYGTSFRLTRFLDWGSKAGLLRVSGAAYQIRHRELLTYLARTPAAPPS